MTTNKQGNTGTITTITLLVLIIAFLIAAGFIAMWMGIAWVYSSFLNEILIGYFHVDVQVVNWNQVVITTLTLFITLHFLKKGWNKLFKKSPSGVKKKLAKKYTKKQLEEAELKGYKEGVKEGANI